MSVSPDRRILNAVDEQFGTADALHDSLTVVRVVIESIYHMASDAANQNSDFDLWLLLDGIEAARARLPKLYSLALEIGGVARDEAEQR